MHRPASRRARPDGRAAARTPVSSRWSSSGRCDRRRRARYRRRAAHQACARRRNRIFGDAVRGAKTILKDVGADPAIEFLQGVTVMREQAGRDDRSGGGTADQSKYRTAAALGFVSIAQMRLISEIFERQDAANATTVECKVASDRRRDRDAAASSSA